MPTTQADASGTLRTLAAITQVDAGGTVRPLQQLWQNDASNTPRLIFSAQTLGISPTYATGSGYSPRTIAITTEQVSVTGAPAGSSYSWVCEEPGFSATAPTQATTSFRANVSPGDSMSSAVYCAVTSGGTTTNTPQAIAYVENVYTGAGA